MLGLKPCNQVWLNHYPDGTHGSEKAGLSITPASVDSSEMHIHLLYEPT